MVVSDFRSIGFSGADNPDRSVAFGMGNNDDAQLARLSDGDFPYFIIPMIGIWNGYGQGIAKNLGCFFK